LGEYSPCSVVYNYDYYNLITEYNYEESHNSPEGLLQTPVAYYSICRKLNTTDTTTCPGDYYATITSNLGITCDHKFTKVWQTEITYENDEGAEETSLAVKYTSEENGC
jgi:hypothetical protein